jgi:hypothetical protein
MSYCRWSTDDHQCDVYVYEGHEGWTVHVAGKRRVLAEAPPDPVPPTDLMTPTGVERFMDRQRRLHAILDRSELVPIGLSHDGQTLITDTPGECADLLVELAAEGYRLPAEVIDELRTEQAELDGTASAPDEAEAH